MAKGSNTTRTGGSATRATTANGGGDNRIPLSRQDFRNKRFELRDSHRAKARKELEGMAFPKAIGKGINYSTKDGYQIEIKEDKSKRDGLFYSVRLSEGVIHTYRFNTANRKSCQDQIRDDLAFSIGSIEGNKEAEQKYRNIEK